MNIDVINNKIKEMLPQKRYRHSLTVANCAVKLSKIYGYDWEKSYIAGITHDCAKYLNKEEVKYYVDKYNITLPLVDTSAYNIPITIKENYITKKKIK